LQQRQSPSDLAPGQSKTKEPGPRRPPGPRKRRPSLRPFAFQKVAQARGCGRTRSIAARQGLEIQWALDGPADVKGDVRADHGRLQILVTEQLLQRADVELRREQVSGERVAGGVGRDELGDAGSFFDCANRVPGDAFVEGWRIAVAAGRPGLSEIAGKSPPRPRARDRWVRAVERRGQRGGDQRAPMETW